MFREAFPMYLATGMTYEEFWEKESWLVKSYREAERIRREEKNYFAWLSGIYTLQALQTGVPVMLTGIAKQIVKLPEFPNKPIDFEKASEEERERKKMEANRAKMQAMVEQFNATFKRKQKEKAKAESQNS